jgi:hypothetical protein
MHTRFKKKNFKGRNHFGGLDVDGRIILKCISNKHDPRISIGFSWLVMW